MKIMEEESLWTLLKADGQPICREFCYFLSSRMALTCMSYYTASSNSFDVENVNIFEGTRLISESQNYGNNGRS